MPGVFLDFTAASCFHKIDAGDVERELKNNTVSIPEKRLHHDPYGHGLVFQHAGIFQFPFITPAAAERIIGSVQWLARASAPPWTTAGRKGAPSTAPSFPMACISSKASCVPNF